MGGKGGIAIVSPWRRGGVPHVAAQTCPIPIFGSSWDCAFGPSCGARVCVAASSKMWVRELRVPLWAARALFGEKTAFSRDF